MARLALEQWQEIRAKREIEGRNLQELAKEYGVSHQAISKRAKKEGWDDGSNHEEAIRRRVAKKVARLNATSSPTKLNEAIEAEAQRRAELIERHRAEWESLRNLELRAIADKDDKDRIDKARALKLLVDQMVARQNQERKLWGVDVELSIDEVKAMTDEELRKAMGRD